MAEAHCLIFPFPIQGHINPMLQFAKRLVHKGLRVTLILTRYLAKTSPFHSPTIAVETISNGLDDGEPHGFPVSSYLSLLKEHGMASLREALHRLIRCGRPATCIVYDPFITWVPELAGEYGIKTAAFFTQSCAVDYIYHRLYSGDLKIGEEEEKAIELPGLPPLLPADLPSFVTLPESYPSLRDMVTDQFKHIENVDWVFCNTLYELEKEVIDFMAEHAPVKAIGPTIPSMYLDRKLADDTDYGLSVFRPEARLCMDWLNRQEPGSVIYVSFGSLAKLSEAQTAELAHGLKRSKRPFLWVVRAAEQGKLPEGFAAEEVPGLVISWCPQLDVLAHDAVACFVTHCGWNSTLEALCLGVPMVGMPQWTDQTTNSKFVADVWGTGVRAVGDGGIVGRESIEKCIREVMEGEKGEEIRKNVSKWKELAVAAVSEGGSSDRNIDDFVSTLRRLAVAAV
ncbi:glycosyltransferase [Genlisea aurea]|uniref:Glycosyltransferase n=1 Tax=Genlisea aurea TaxID=192259 RepID=S8CWY8_9LAMI|nr:glycosyltransferase [Genlisea aurea]